MSHMIPIISLKMVLPKVLKREAVDGFKNKKEV